MSDYSLGYRQRMFAVAETGGYGAACPPTAGAFQAREAVINLSEERRVRRDRKNHRSVGERLRGKREVKWSITLADAPVSAAAGSRSSASSELDPLYGATFEIRTTPAATVLAGGEQNATAPTTSGCDVALASGSYGSFSPGSLIGIETADGRQAVVISEVQSFATDHRVRLSWEPALPAAPAAGTRLEPSQCYFLLTNPQGSVTLHRALDRHGECVSGAIPNSWTFTASAGEEALIEVAGLGQDLARFGPLALSRDVGADATIFPVEELHAAILKNGAAFYQVAPQSLSPEIVTVVGTTPGEGEEDPGLSVIRGVASTTAKDYPAGTALTPYYPDLTTCGAAIAGIFGQVRLNDRVFEVTRAKIALTENVKLRNESFGSAVATGYLYPTDREVKVELDGFLKTGEAPWAAAARQESVGILLQIGTEGGRIHAFYLPRVELDVPGIEAPADAEIPLSLAGTALTLNEAGPNYELFHAYL